MNRVLFLYKCQFLDKILVQNITTLEFFYEIYSAVEKGKIVTGLFLDFAKAFDTVDHEIFVSKLYIIVIRGVALEVFKSYLFNWHQFVYICGWNIH